MGQRIPLLLLPDVSLASVAGIFSPPQKTPSNSAVASPVKMPATDLIETSGRRCGRPRHLSPEDDLLYINAVYQTIIFFLVIFHENITYNNVDIQELL